MCAWGGSRGSLVGVPAPNYKGQFRRIPPTSPPRPFKFASKFMSILMSIFGRFGVDLGSLLAVIFGQVGAFFDPSWSWNRLRTVLSSKKYLFTKPLNKYVFRHFFAQDGAPKQPKIAQRRVQDRLGSLFFPLDISLRFLIVLGFVCVPISPPKWSPGGAELC